MSHAASTQVSIAAGGRSLRQRPFVAVAKAMKARGARRPTGQRFADRPLAAEARPQDRILPYVAKRAPISIPAIHSPVAPVLILRSVTDEITK